MIRALLLITLVFACSSVFTVACDNNGASGLVDTETVTQASVVSAPGALSLNATDMTIRYGAQYTFVAAGGTPPYEYEFASRGAGGTLTNATITSTAANGAATNTVTAVYMAGNQDGTDQIVARDAKGLTASATVVVNNSSPTSVLNPISSPSTRLSCAVLAGTGIGGVQVACGGIEGASYLNSICADQSDPPTKTPSSRGYIAAGCPNVNNAAQGVALNVNCCAMRTVGTTYSRTIGASSSKAAAVYCGSNESATFLSAVCGTGTGTTAPQTVDSRGGFSVSCATPVTASITIRCDGSF